MFEQDYIMRQVQQFTAFLTQVLLKKKEGEQQEAQKLVEKFLAVLTQGSTEDFHELSLLETLTFFEHKGDFNSVLALVIADLLYEERDLLSQEEPEHCSLQALLLYQKAAQDSAVAFPLQAYHKIDQLKEELTGADKLGDVETLL